MPIYQSHSYSREHILYWKVRLDHRNEQLSLHFGWATLTDTTVQAVLLYSCSTLNPNQPIALKPVYRVSPFRYLRRSDTLEGPVDFSELYDMSTTAGNWMVHSEDQAGTCIRSSLSASAWEKDSRHWFCNPVPQRYYRSSHLAYSLSLRYSTPPSPAPWLNVLDFWGSNCTY